ncbi:MAG TPA: hypothetical protein VLN57_20965 [Xanthobacteraceae bacterium]|nr:hypothetical protein [Xanthobacteraceae bacterium]
MKDHVAPYWHPDGWQSGTLIREVLQPPPSARRLGLRIAGGVVMLCVGACIMGAIAQRLEASDRAAVSRISEMRCGR